MAFPFHRPHPLPHTCTHTQRIPTKPNLLSKNTTSLSSARMEPAETIPSFAYFCHGCRRMYEQAPTSDFTCTICRSPCVETFGGTNDGSSTSSSHYRDLLPIHNRTMETLANASSNQSTLIPNPPPGLSPERLRPTSSTSSTAAGVSRASLLPLGGGSPAFGRRAAAAAAAARLEHLNSSVNSSSARRESEERLIHPSQDVSSSDNRLENSTESPAPIRGRTRQQRAQNNLSPVSARTTAVTEGEAVDDNHQFTPQTTVIIRSRDRNGREVETRAIAGGEEASESVRRAMLDTLRQQSHRHGFLIERETINNGNQTRGRGGDARGGSTSVDASASIGNRRERDASDPTPQHRGAPRFGRPNPFQRQGRSPSSTTAGGPRRTPTDDELFNQNPFQFLFAASGQGLQTPSPPTFSSGAQTRSSQDNLREESSETHTPQPNGDSQARREESGGERGDRGGDPTVNIQSRVMEFAFDPLTGTLRPVDPSTSPQEGNGANAAGGVHDIQTLLHRLFMQHQPNSRPTPRHVIDGLRTIATVTPELRAENPFLLNPCAVCQESLVHSERARSASVVRPSSVVGTPILPMPPQQPQHASAAPPTSTGGTPIASGGSFPTVQGLATAETGEHSTTFASPTSSTPAPPAQPGAPSPIIVLPCNHCFHKECLLPWLERSQQCPICRRNVTGNEERNEHESAEHAETNSGEDLPAQTETASRGTSRGEGRGRGGANVHQLNCAQQ